MATKRPDNTLEEVAHMVAMNMRYRKALGHIRDTLNIEQHVASNHEDTIKRLLVYIKEVLH